MGNITGITTMMGGLVCGAAVVASCSFLDTYRAVKTISELGKCERAAGELALSNYELVRATDAIALAKVIRVGKVPARPRGGNGVYGLSSRV